MTTYSGVPTGYIMGWIANKPIPAGFLACDGTTVKQSQYPKLWHVIGMDYKNDEFILPQLSQPRDYYTLTESVGFEHLWMPSQAAKGKWVELIYIIKAI